MLIGVVGKPSAGKSTFFKAATLAQVETANYPFTTIEPNHAVGFIKTECAGKFFDQKSNPRHGYCIGWNRFVPIDLIDVAGLVPGAHKGQGMGNQFLDDLRQADVLIHVIDISGSINEKGEPVKALEYDPLKDVAFLEDELDNWYLGILKKGWEKFARQMQQEKQEVHKAIGKQLSGLSVDEDMVKTGIKELNLDPDNPAQWSEDELLKLSQFLRLQTKPMLIAANKVDVPGATENLEKMKKEYPNLIVVPCSAESELALKEAEKHALIDYVPGEGSFTPKEGGKLSDAQSKALSFIESNVLKPFGSTGVQKVLDAAVFDLLKYMAIYPGGVNRLADKDGNVLPDCFLMPKDSTAIDFAEKLHTDFAKNFIRAIDVRTKRTVGKDHPLKDGDVVEIVADK